MDKLTTILVLISLVIILSLSLVVMNLTNNKTTSSSFQISTNLPSSGNCLQAVIPKINQNLSYNFKTSSCVGITISESTNTTTINKSVIYSVLVSNYYPNFTLDDFGVWYINIVNNTGQSVYSIDILQPCPSPCNMITPKILPGTSYGPEEGTWNVNTNPNFIASVKSGETYYATFQPVFNNYPSIFIHSNLLPIYVT